MQVRNRINRLQLPVVQLLSLYLILSISGCRTKPTSEPSLLYSAEDQKNFAEFTKRVEGYAELRAGCDGKLTPLKPTDNPEAILVHQKELAQSIADARKTANRGEIFTDPISASFRKVIRAKLNEPGGQDISKTILQGEPLHMNLKVNEVYPEDVPLTTVPPTILAGLPRLPAHVEYRVVGALLVLDDGTANLVVDYMNGAFPKQGL